MSQLAIDDMELTVRKLLVPMYPAPARGFTDITRVLERDPAAFCWLVDRLVAQHRARPPDAVLAIDACGYLFGAPLAWALTTRFVMARRAGKLPRVTLRR